MRHPDYVIAGAGLIGLSLALELECRGARVVLLEAGRAARQTTFAAAGMLAVEDASNPAALYEFARLSASLYPGFLARIGELCGLIVPFQTSTTYEAGVPVDDPLRSTSSKALGLLADDAPPFTLLAEHSIDPRQLGAALHRAVLATSIDLRENTAMGRLTMGPSSIEVETPNGTLSAAMFIDCMGTWSPAPVVPRKGQMLAVKMPVDFELDAVVRTNEVYIVPRTAGPYRGRAIIGATVEDVGFDLTVHAADVLALHARAVRLLPGLAEAEFLEAWAGLRPATADGLPLLGFAPGQPRYLVATGHFRNGILLAPGTARVLAQLLAGEAPAINLAAFSPMRFASV